MAWRDATEDEINAIMSGPAAMTKEAGPKFRDATPEEAAQISGGSYVAPGDVAARKAQGQRNAAAEGPNKVREDLTITGELASGLGNTARGVADTVTGLIPGVGKSFSEAFLPQEISLAGLLNIAPVKAALGAAQVAGAPLAPLTNKAARAGEFVSDLTGSDALAGLTEAGINVLAPGALFKAPKAVAAVAEKVAPGITGKVAKGLRYKNEKISDLEELGKQQLGEVEDRAAAGVTKAQKEFESVRDTTSAQAAKEVAEANQLRDVGVEEAKRTAQISGKKLAGIKAKEASELEGVRTSAQLERDAVDAYVEKAKRSLPTDDDIKAMAGSNTAEATGAAFKSHFETTRAARKTASDELYDAALGPREAGQKAVTDTLDDLQDTGTSLLEQMRAAKGTADEAAAQKRYADFLSTGKVADDVSLRDLHADLLRTRREHRAATRLQEDDIARQLNIKEKDILDTMEKASPGVTEKLAAADANYAENFAPYFSKGSITRAIADKDPSVIAKNAILPRSKSGKEVETIQRTLELIGDNEPLRRQVAQAHFGGLIDEASKAKDFREGLVKGWERYTNPSGNNNKVLRAAYGKDYDRFNSMVNQFKHSTARSIDDMAKQVYEGINKRSAAAERSVVEGTKKVADPLESLVGGTPSAIEDVVRGTRQETGKIQREAAGVIKGAEGKAATSIKFTNKARDIEIAAIKKRMTEDIEKLTGRKGNTWEAGKFIGPLFIVESVFDTFTKGAAQGVMKASVGASLILSRKAMNTFIRSEKGVGLLKQALRAAPGSTQAAAVGRMMQDFLKRAQGEESNE